MVIILFTTTYSGESYVGSTSYDEGGLDDIEIQWYIYRLS